MHFITTRMFLVLCLLALIYPFSGFAAPERRVALIIGNSNYDVGRLKNPVNDATDMANALKKIGFSVILKNDAGHKEMEKAIKEFGHQLKKDDVGLFFYAGHGVQIDGRNYLIPLGANIEDESDVEYKAVNLNRVFDVMDSAGNRLNIIILDACRDNPYAKSFRSSTRGLAVVGKSPRDTLIAYSTSPGQVAMDGRGRNSPYTKALLNNISLPGLPIEQVFKKVRNDLNLTTSGKQNPWYLASLGVDFYFVPGSGKTSTNRVESSMPTHSPVDELEEENRKLEVERLRLAAERDSFAKKQALEEKRQKIEEERAQLAAEREEARQAAVRKKAQATTTLAMGKRPPTEVSGFFTAKQTPKQKNIILATTTSTQDSGLLDVLIPIFEKETGYFVKTIAVGSGQAMAMGQKGEADVMLVHSPDAEKKFITDGYGINRRLVMHNDFVIVGPRTDAANIGNAGSSADALKLISNRNVLFISRGDNSGVHSKEKMLWKNVGINPVGQKWYQETGLGMGQTLNVTSEKKGYTLADRGTYLAMKKSLALNILLEGDAALLNIYHVIEVNSGRWPKANTEGAKAFADFMVAKKTQDIIKTFGVTKFGSPLFFPDAGKKVEDLGK